MTTETIEHKCHFTVDPEGITSLVRQMWTGENKKAAALKILMDGFGMGMDDALSVISGSNKLVSPDGVNFDLQPDSPEEGQPWKIPATLVDFLNYVSEMEKRYVDLMEVDKMATIVHVATGMKYRSPISGLSGERINHASSCGYITPQVAIHFLCQHLPYPTKEQWTKFWDEWTPEVREICNELKTPTTRLRDSTESRIKEVETKLHSIEKKKSDPIAEEMARIQKLPLRKWACLKITSWVGTSIGATHYYGKLSGYYINQSTEDIELEYTISRKEADILNEKDTSIYPGMGHWRAGDKTGRFDTTEEIITRAVQSYKEHFPEAEGLLLGDPLNISRVLDAKDPEDKIQGNNFWFYTSKLENGDPELKQFELKWERLMHCK